MKECYSEVEAEGEGRSSIAQDILRKRTDFFRRIIVSLCRTRVSALSLPSAEGLHLVGFVGER